MNHLDLVCQGLSIAASGARMCEDESPPEPRLRACREVLVHVSRPSQATGSTPKALFRARLNDWNDATRSADPHLLDA
jgi:hypothetical protein